MVYRLPTPKPDSSTTVASTTPNVTPSPDYQNMTSSTPFSVETSTPIVQNITGGMKSEMGIIRVAVDDIIFCLVVVGVTLLIVCLIMMVQQGNFYRYIFFCPNCWLPFVGIFLIYFFPYFVFEKSR